MDVPPLGARCRAPAKYTPRRRTREGIGTSRRACLATIGAATRLTLAGTPIQIHGAMRVDEGARPMQTQLTLRQRLREALEPLHCKHHPLIHAWARGELSRATMALWAQGHSP